MPRIVGERIVNLPLNTPSAVPIYRQVYDGLRDAIVRGALAPSTRLPSTRSLAADLRISRNTVVMAYEQLRAEGYAVGRMGSDTRVATDVPELLARLPARRQRNARHAGSGTVAKRAHELEKLWARGSAALDRPPRAFRAGVPAVDVFPYALWGRMLARRWRQVSARELGYANPRGYLPLRHAIASYVGAARGVRCHPDQVFVMTGSQSAIGLAARLTIDPGDQAWVEDPGYHGAHGALLSAGASLVPVAVDADGLVVSAGVKAAPTARVAFVTPNRQMPLGVTLSAARRRELLAWAAGARAWIIEDDYDSEFRFAARQVAALQSEDRHDCVFYAGTFSKALFPALRIGYLIVPRALVGAAEAARHFSDYHSPMLEQMVLADFLDAGHFERHVRRMRVIYREREETLRAAVRRKLSGVLEITPVEGGLSLVAWLRGVDAGRFVKAAAERHVDLTPLDRLAIGPVPPGVMLGYAGIDVADIREGVDRLADAVASLRARERQSASAKSRRDQFAQNG